MSERIWVRRLAETFIVFFRGAPVLILLYLVYYGFGQIEALRNGPLWLLFGSAFGCAIVAFSLNHAAFMAEVLRGALLAVPAGMVEASQALGISPRNVFLYVRMPLAMRYGLPAYQNEVVSFIKGTAIVSVITITDLTAVANGIFEQTYDPFTPILCAAALYWALREHGPPRLPAVGRLSRPAQCGGAGHAHRPQAARDPHRQGGAVSAAADTRARWPSP